MIDSVTGDAKWSKVLRSASLPVTVISQEHTVAITYWNAKVPVVMYPFRHFKNLMYSFVVGLCFQAKRTEILSVALFESGVSRCCALEFHVSLPPEETLLLVQI